MKRGIAIIRAMMPEAVKRVGPVALAHSFGPYPPVAHLLQPFEVIDRPLWWHKRGLQQTATGYGSKLTTAHCVVLPDGRVRRIYVTCYSNSGTPWITLDGQRVVVRDWFLRSDGQ